MKLEQQVVSLELAQKLKELGVVQKSLFYIDEQDQEITYGMFAAPTFPGHTYISTFTVAELGEMLPAFVDTKEFRYSLHIDKGGKPWWWVDYRNGETTYNKFDVLFCGEADNEADARAKLLINLLQNKLIEL